MNIGNARIIDFMRNLRDAGREVLINFPKRIECNVCHWSGRRLISDSWHPHTICPKCGSQVRHRLLLSAFKAREEVIGRSLVQNADVLHFAPERVLAKFLFSGARKYVTADLLRKDVDMQIDMCDMQSIPDGSFDLVVACDVLEHVPDDSKAMQELKRILRPGGLAILTVPQKDGLSSTYEDVTITTEEGRLQAFGQEDHLRIYGNNFPEILERNGFDVSIYDETSFSPETVTRHVLFPPILSTHPLATNYRKIFFAYR